MPRASIPLPDSFVFATEIPVRISDVNYGNHLGNDAVLSILHEARLQFLARHAYSEKDLAGAGLIMVDAAVQYRAQAAYGDPLRIELAVTGWSRTGFDLTYRVTHAGTGQEIARARTGMCFFDYTAGRVVRAPAEVRDALT